MRDSLSIRKAVEKARLQQEQMAADRVLGEGRLGDLSFKVVDTAGLEQSAPESLSGRMRTQTQAAIADADVVMFMLDARAGALPADQSFAELVRKSGKPAIVVATAL